LKKIFTPIIGKPNVSKDKFWYVDRKFFDRSSWGKLIEVDNFDNKNKNNESSEIEIKFDKINIHDFIKANSIRINIPTTNTITSSGRASPLDIEIDINDENDEEDYFYRGW